jgi:hypothetical protein
MPNAEIAKQASKGGRAAARRRLTLERVEQELHPLDSLESAMLRLDRVGLWAAAGMLSGSVASAVVRSVEVWIRGHESRLTSEVIETLRSEVARLKAQLTGVARGDGNGPPKSGSVRSQAAG